jgi:hypothetical protein
VLLEADPHSLPLERQYCGDQHGQGPGTAYYALRQGPWKLLLGDPAGGAGDGWCRRPPDPSIPSLPAFARVLLRYCTGAPCNYIGWNSSNTTFTAQSVSLFDVVADMAEQHDLAAVQPAVVARLLAAIRRYNDSAVPSYVCGAAGPWHPNETLTPFA